MSRTSRWPRAHAWFVVLLGFLTIAHLWSHSVYPPGDPHAIVEAVADGGHHEHEGDHGGQAHSHLFVTASVTTVADDPAEWPAAVVPPAGSAHGRVQAPRGRAPPDDYRGRAALTQTLEVCRC
ncbi:hypothetical protein ACQEUU_25090 [Nonomuraea sp. CA-218870]|uniref:hypothetical protein n=1 Tax=Nonomuraea sp. CA-218870 TaxID=3239998 RepID=UPI003D8B16C5